MLAGQVDYFLLGQLELGGCWHGASAAASLNWTLSIQPLAAIMTDASKTDIAATSIDSLLAVMAQLRNPEGGCPWDLEQDFHSIAPYTLEEAYEVADAISRGSMDDLKEELGDLLLQVVFHAQMAKEAQAFDFGDVVEAIVSKMVRRHPHVFGDESHRTAEEVLGRWDEIKAAEKAAKRQQSDSLLDQVPANLPGLMQAAKLQKKAAKVGFDWPEAARQGEPAAPLVDAAAPVFAKVAEELDELRSARSLSEDQLEEELGDLLFSCVNLARHLKLEPDAALRRANRKFRGRFQHMEAAAPAGLKQLSASQLEALWEAAKAAQSRG